MNDHHLCRQTGSQRSSICARAPPQSVTKHCRWTEAIPSANRCTRQTIRTTEDNKETTWDNSTARGPFLHSGATPPLQHRNCLLHARRAHARQRRSCGSRPPPTQVARATRACSLGRVTGGSGRYNLLRRPREPADPGLVAKSDVVYRIQTEGRRPAASSSGSDSGVRKAPGRHPPRPPLVWAGECTPPGPPPSSATLFASPLLWPRAPGDSLRQSGRLWLGAAPRVPAAGLDRQPAAGLDRHPQPRSFTFRAT